MTLANSWKFLLSNFVPQLLRVTKNWQECLHSIVMWLIGRSHRNKILRRKKRLCLNKLESRFLRKLKVPLSIFLSPPPLLIKGLISTLIRHSHLEISRSLQHTNYGFTKTVSQWSVLALFLGNTEKVTPDYNPMGPKLGEPCHQFPKSGVCLKPRAW